MVILRWILSLQYFLLKAMDCYQKMVVLKSLVQILYIQDSKYQLFKNRIDSGQFVDKSISKFRQKTGLYAPSLQLT